jgi:hypothetical protein
VSKLHILLVALLLLTAVAGCETLGTRTGVEYGLDLDKIGTGQQAIVPINDYTRWDGPSHHQPRVP